MGLCFVQYNAMGFVMAKEWLSLKDAAGLLGVHTSTVRKWANDGKLPVYLTAGGHRRFKSHEIELWKQAHDRPEKADYDRMIQRAIQVVHLQVSAGQMEMQEWYLKLLPEARDHYRATGRMLAQGIMIFLSVPNVEGIAQAAAMGVDYGATSRKYGLTQSEAVQAFLFFRSLLLEAMITVYEEARVPSLAAWGEMLRKFHQFTDQVLLAVLDSYEIRKEVLQA
jgi:excisionase family DNA binding protein